jgi:LPS sulfotransferase NodH
MPDYRGVGRRLILAAVPRCGSHFIGHTLASTGQLGFPLEYFKTSHWEAWGKRAGTADALGVLNSLYASRTSPSGVFSCKLQWDHVRFVVDAGLSDLFQDATVVLILRQDILAQAISLAIARQTGSWISEQVPLRAAVYSRSEIESAIAAIIEREGKWRAFLASIDVVPKVVSYEAFCEDPDFWTAEIAKSVGVELDPRGKPLKSSTEIQRSAESEQWRMSYLKAAVIKL